MCIVILTKNFVIIGIIWYHMLPSKLCLSDPLHGRLGNFKSFLKEYVGCYIFSKSVCSLCFSFRKFATLNVCSRAICSSRF